MPSSQHPLGRVFLEKVALEDGALFEGVLGPALVIRARLSEHLLKDPRSSSRGLGILVVYSSNEDVLLAALLP
jgi:hypothetical protein